VCPLLPTSQDLGAVKALRGKYRRKPLEYAFPLTMVLLLISFPIRVALLPNAMAAPVFLLILVFGVLPGLGLYLIYFSTSSFEFDGANVICRRLGNIVVWCEPLYDLEAVRRRWGRFKDSLELKWSNRRRWVVLTNDLEAALNPRRTRSK
jgi:hypothetical protein